MRREFTLAISGQSWNLRIVLMLATFLMSACSLDSLVRVDDPDQSRVIERDKVKSLSGAIGLYYNSILSVAAAVSETSYEVGRMTDELTYVTDGSFSGAAIDARYSSRDVGLQSSAYNKLQAARVQASQATELLLQYGTEKEHPYVGHAYALQGYTELLLAEILCSGIPLTLVPFENDYHYTRGFTTTEVLQKAIAHFDTAISYAADSLPIATFARVGKGRAYLSLKDYTAAAAAVADVPTSAKYILQFVSGVPKGSFWTSNTSTLNSFRIVNNEGTNGLAWAALNAIDQDPRLPILRSGGTMRQQKFTTATVNMTVASGIEARLIEAEAMLQPADNPSGDWLAKINEARHTQAGLADTTDPGSANARIDLLFRERAFWFYLDGHRLGDFRRLVRNYGRLSQSVYPSGTYYSNGVGVLTYGTEVVFVPAMTETTLNPLYDGCINRDA